MRRTHEVQRCRLGARQLAWRRAAWFALGVCALLLAAVAPVARVRADSELSALLAGLQAVQAMSAHFREEKHMALLAVPLVSEGEIYYEKPRRFSRLTTSPQQERLLLDGSSLRFGRGEQLESLSLDAHPAVRVLVDTFVSVLAGDQRSLEALAQVEVTRPKAGASGPKPWRITLLPRASTVRKIVNRMVFEGSGAKISRVEWVDQNGDRTITRFSGIKFVKQFSSEERRRVFHVER